MTEIELELISDTDMYLFLEKGMRGGISYIALGHSKSNNKYMNSCDDNKPTIHIIYLVANNLYGWEIANKYDIKIGGAKILVLNLGNEGKYVVHYRNL